MSPLHLGKFGFGICSLLITAGLASADTVNFVATGVQLAPVSFPSSTTAYSVSATGFENVGLMDITSRPVMQTAAGLGIKGLDGFDAQIDGVGVNEHLTLTFTKTVRLESLTFGLVDTNGTDNFTLYNSAGLTAPAMTLVGSPDTVNFPNSTLYIGKVFKLSVAVATAAGNSSDYSLRGLSATVVPTPSAIWGGGSLLGLAGGFLAIRRFRRIA